jgi:protein-S-isoprenylcysteine O-methyltransferase Ste14
VASLPYRQPGADTAFSVLLGLFVVGEYAIRFRSRLNSGSAPAERWSRLVIVMAVVGGLLGAFALARWPPTTMPAGRWPLFVLGLVLMAVGIVIRLWAVVALGRFFTVDVRVQSNQQVVNRGPYRWVRHPSYTGMIVFFLGVGLALTDWASLVILIVLPTAGLVVRIRSEERALLAGLGDDYRRFASTRRRLLPGVW